MTKRARTKDESFILKLYETVKAAGDESKEIPQEVIGRLIGVNDNSIRNVVNMLAQANFLKKGQAGTVRITENGIRLAESLLGQL